MTLIFYGTFEVLDDNDNETNGTTVSGSTSQTIPKTIPRATSGMFMLFLLPKSLEW